jgi:ubiquitin-conjugating enzyme E2 S
MEGPTGTPYEGKCFALKLVFPAQFPSQPPRGFFLTRLYHPNVEFETGAICVNTLKKDWTVNTSVAHVLGVIRCLLIIPFPESSLNDEAGKLFMESYEEYSKRARLMADVHGRPIVPAAAAGGRGTSPASSSSEARVLKSSSDNPMPAVAAARTAAGSKKKLTRTMSKKKSLKRL